ncbi:MAG: hypothetical protein AAF999_16845 [Pseudomonadota bacterium]
MTGKNGSTRTKAAAQSREDRLKAALKANLARRKAQNRKRAQDVGQAETAPGKAGQDKDA